MSVLTIESVDDPSIRDILSLLYLHIRLMNEQLKVELTDELQKVMPLLLRL